MWANPQGITCKSIHRQLPHGYEQIYIDQQEHMQTTLCADPIGDISPNHPLWFLSIHCHVAGNYRNIFILLKVDNYKQNANDSSYTFS